jgi:hypothetical protein
MELTTQSNQEILDVANPIMDNLMTGSTKIAHAKHTKDFRERLKVIITKEYFEPICRRYQAEWGYFFTREFVAAFRLPSSVAVVWKQWCTRQEGEFVAEIVLVENDSRYLVDHEMVF